MLDNLPYTPQEQTYNINTTTKKDPEQDYSGFGYALNNLFRSGALNNGLGGLLGGNIGNNELVFGNNQQGMYSNLMPFLADYFWGNKYRTTDTNQTTPSINISPYNQNSIQNLSPYLPPANGQSPF